MGSHGNSTLPRSSAAGQRAANIFARGRRVSHHRLGRQRDISPAIKAMVVVYVPPEDLVFFGLAFASWGVFTGTRSRSGLIPWSRVSMNLRRVATSSS